MNREFTRRLPQEVSGWEREHLIDEAQARAILARYGLDGELLDRQGRAVYALAVLGALLLGTGLITFIAANWQALSAGMKLGINVLGLSVAYGAGYWLRYARGNYPRLGEGLIFLGSLLFGAAVFLIAQAYHIRAHEPYLLYLWALGILPLAYLLAHTPILVLALMAVSVGLVWDLGEASPHWMAGLGAYLAYGLLLAMLGEAHRTSPRLAPFAGRLGGLGRFIVFLVLYILSFRALWTGTPDSEAVRAFAPATAFGWRLLFLTGGTLLAAGIYAWRSRPLAASERWEPAVLLLLLTLPWVLALAGGRLYSPEGVFYPPAAIFFNLLLFALTLGLIALGYRQHRPELVNAGIWFFGLHLLTRYLDIFGRLLHTSLVFIGAGLLLLLGGAFLERTRQRLVEEPSPSPAREGESQGEPERRAA